MDSAFSAVDKFWDLCIVTDQPKMDSQLTNIAYIIFNKPWFFTEALKTWNKQDNTNKTYAIFKLHIRKEYNELQKVGALTLAQWNINPQANLTQDLPTNKTFTNEITRELRSTIMDGITLLHKCREKHLKNN